MIVQELKLSTIKKNIQDWLKYFLVYIVLIYLCLCQNQFKQVIHHQ